MSPHSFYGPPQLAHCQAGADQVLEYRPDYSQIQRYCSSVMCVDSTMPTKVMARGIGVPLIQVEMVLAGGKAERLPVGGQHHHALAPA